MGPMLALVKATMEGNFWSTNNFTIFFLPLHSPNLMAPDYFLKEYLKVGCIYQQASKQFSNSKITCAEI